MVKKNIMYGRPVMQIKNNSIITPGFTPYIIPSAKYALSDN